MKYLTAWSLSILTVGFFLFTSCAHELSVDEKAKKTMMDYLLKNKFVVKCGESFYSNHMMMLVQYERAYAEITPRELTYAAKLNSVEWAGAGDLKYTAWRSYQSHGGWSLWQSPQEQAPHFTVWKEKGHWFVSPDNVVKETMQSAKPLDCKEIEALPK
jgi:hypothetical protein